MPVTVVVDSTADLPQAMVSAHQIRVVPLNVHFGDEVFRDKLDLSTIDFYRRLETVTRLPTTSQPSVGAFAEVYSSIPADHGVVSVHLASNLSGTFQAASLAARDSGRDIRLVDSASVSMGTGFVAMAAVAAGDDLEAAEAAALSIVPRTKVYAALDTLKFVVMGGRVSRARAAVGGMLNVKPVLEVRQGEVEQVGFTRSRRKSIEKLVGLLQADAPVEQVAVIHGACPDEAEMLRSAIREAFPGLEVLLEELGPVVGTHAGPGCIGVAFVGRA